MKESDYCLFEAPLGWCGIAWRRNQPAVTLFQLPAGTAAMTESKIAQS